MTAILRTIFFAAAAAFFFGLPAAAHAIIWIPGEEITTRPPGWSRDSSHMVAIGVGSHTSARLSLQGQIDSVRNKGGIAILPHPYATWRTPGFSYKAIKSLNGYTGIEMTKLTYNTNNSTRYWGWDHYTTWSPVHYRLFSKGQRTWGFRNPDADYLSSAARKSAVVVRASANTRGKVMGALRRGDFYSVRVDNPASPYVLRSFPFPKVSSNGIVSVVAPRGYSVRMFGATSNTPLMGNCSHYVNGQKITEQRQVCAKNNYQTTFSRKATGKEKFIKFVVIKYTDTYRYPNAVYQPIFLNSNGTTRYNPYAPTNPVSGQRLLGALHLHTRNSKDNPRGPSAATLLSWYSAKGYHFVSVTDHNRVTTDFVRPKPLAPWSAWTRQGQAVRLYYRGYDRSNLKFTIKIKDKSTGRVVRVVRSGWKRPGGLYSIRFDGNLPRGRYAYGVYAMDSSYNWGSWSSWKSLTIR